MPDYSYTCTSATPLRDLGRDSFGDRILLCGLEFETEDGHPMLGVEGIVALRSYGATIVTEMVDLLPNDLPETVLQPLVDSGDVGFDIYNQEEIATRLLALVG